MRYLKQVLVSGLRITVMCLYVVFISCSRSNAEPPGADKSASEIPKAEATAARLGTLDQNLTAIEAQERSAARDHWDPGYVVNMVGRDPQKLFAWVKNNTVWIPYRGVLRGPIGVLIDRQGNSLDQSLLLATFLREVGETVQLVHGEMDSQQAATLVPDLIARQVTAYGVRGVDASLAQGSQTTTVQFLSADPQVDQAIAQQNQSAEHMMSELDARVADQSERLLRTVPKPDSDAEWASRFSAAIAALQDHWWVQRWDGQTWVDMDLFSPSPDGSSPLSFATETVEIDSLEASAPYQEIAVRVVAEQMANSALKQHTALEHVLRPADMIGQSIVLQFWPTAPLTEEQSNAADEQSTKPDFKKSALDQHEWGGFLIVGREVVDGAILPETGEDPEAAQEGGAFGGLAGGFSSSTDSDNSSSEEGILSAVWLEYEIRRPGEEPRTIRRTVFDLIGPDARAKGGRATLSLTDSLRLERSQALMMRTEILPVVSRLAPEFVAHLMAQSLLGNRTLVHGALRADKSAGLAAAETLPEDSVPPLSALYALALVRQAHSDPRFTLIDRPVVLTNHSYPESVNGDVTVVAATDIVANEVGISLAAPDAFTIRVAQGVRDTNAESLLMGAGSYGNAGDAFAVSSAWLTLAAADQDAVNQLELSVDVRRRILEDLADGNVVVAPKGVVSMKPQPFAGWWRINPATGDVLGLGESGWGEVLASEGLADTRAGYWARSFTKIGKWFLRGFVSNYGFCLAQWTEIHTEETRSLRVGFKLAVSDSLGQCVGDSAFIGAMVTAPLVVRTTAGGVKVPVEPPRPPKPPVPPEPPCGGGGQSNKTQAMPNAPPRPNLGGTQPMPNAPPRPHLGGTQPMLGAPPGPNVAEGMPKRGPSPLAESVDPANSPKSDLSESVAEPANRTPAENNSQKDFRSRDPQAEIAAAREAVAEANRIYAEKADAARQAQSDLSSAQLHASEKAGEWIRYTTKGNQYSKLYDPETFDPTVDAELKAASDAADATRDALMKRASNANADLKQANEQLMAKKQDLLKRSPVDRAADDLAFAKDNLDAKRQEYEKAESEAKDLRPKAIEKVGESLRQQAKGDPRIKVKSTDNHDANAAERARQQADDAMSELHDAEVKWQKALDELVKADKYYNSKKAALDALKNAACN